MKARILVVNDEEDLGEMCRLVLGRRGYIVDNVTSIGAMHDAIEASPPDLVLLDWIVGPETGDKALLHFRREGGAGFPILVMSGTPGVEKTAERLGARAFLAKPFSASRLAEEVDRLLEGATPGTAR